MTRRGHDGQLGLFTPATAPAAVEPARQPAAVTGLAERLPAGFRLGTSSWAYPGWEGAVWQRAYDEAALARHGLAAYAAHPLLRTVSLDRAFHAPMTAAQYAALAGQVPADFRFVVKAPAECTMPRLRQPSPVTGSRDNRRFLDPGFAATQVVAPLLEGVGERLGLLLLQFPPMPPAWLADPAPFVERLQQFLASLPPALPRAVEVRNPELLVPTFFDALELTGTRYCYTVHPNAPGIAEQHEALPAELAGEGPLVIRWNLRHGDTHERANARFAPFTHLQEEDRVNRPAIAALCRRALAAGRSAYVIAGNRAEGCAPATLQRLAEEIVAP